MFFVYCSITRFCSKNRLSRQFRPHIVINMNLACIGKKYNQYKHHRHTSTSLHARNPMCFLHSLRPLVFAAFAL